MRGGVNKKEHDKKMPSLYRGHTPSTRLGKLLIGADAAWRALANPRDARLVGIVGEATGHAALSQLHKRMQCHPVGQAILHDRPAITAGHSKACVAYR